MRRFAFLAFVLALGATLPAAAGDTWLLDATKLYIAPDVPAISNAIVLVRDGKIVAAGTRKTVQLPPVTRVFECAPGVVTAGFQNSHVHFMEPVWNNAARRPAPELQSALEAMLTRYGVTTAFDTASDQLDTVALRTRIEKGEVRGPRILTVGSPLYPPDGIPFYLKDVPPDDLGKMHQPRNADEARAAVRENLANGADGTKLFLHTSPDRKSPRFMTLEVARAAAEETHRQGKLVFAHPTSLDGVHAAVAAGVDVLVHTTLGEEASWDAPTLQKMVAAHMSVIPTFKLWKYELATKDQVPMPIIEKLIGKTQQELRDFKIAGGQVLFGTDVGYMRDYDPTDEYDYMSQAGMSPMEILASLTTAPAARLKESARRGRVAQDMDADLVVLSADPADDVKNFAQVRCVIRGGRQIYPAPASGQTP